jgi:hypothetical protein
MRFTTSYQTSLFPVQGNTALKPGTSAEPDPKEGIVTQNHINERVKVYALYRETRDQRFPHDKLRPVMFIWRNQEYRVQDVTYVWREHRGEAELYHFAVSDGTNVFELCYNARNLDWTLSGIACE